MPSYKSPKSGTRSTSRTRSPGSPSTPIIAADLGQGHTSRGHIHSHGRGTRLEGSSTQPLADASNLRLLPRALDSEDLLERRRRKMRDLLSSPTPQGREAAGLPLGPGPPPNNARRGRKSRDHHQRPTRRSSSTPAGGSQRMRKDDAMRAWHPTQPLPPGQSWYIRRRDPPHPKLNANGNKDLKPTRPRRASAGSATLADPRSLPVQKGTTGVMKGWYTAVCKRFGVAGLGSGSKGVPLLKPES